MTAMVDWCAAEERTERKKVVYDARRKRPAPKKTEEEPAPEAAAGPAAEVRPGFAHPQKQCWKELCGHALGRPTRSL